MPAQPPQPAACFKAYDVRGRIGIDLDAPLTVGIARAFARVMQPRRVVIGHDCRLSSPDFAAALSSGFRAEGTGVDDLGLCGTEEVYFATAHVGADGGLMVTASHNPIDYNGIKFVGPGARPLTAEEFAAIGAMAAGLAAAPGAAPAATPPVSTRAAYAAHIAGFADAARLGPLRLVVNAGNGVAGQAFDAILSVLEAGGAQIAVTRLDHRPDGRFPNGIPNPLLVDNRAATAAAVRDAGADMGIAWDADFDRCFLFDETGAFVDGEYVVGLLAETFLGREPGATVVHDPRVIWNTRDRIARGGGVAVQAPTGHAWMKAAMRASGAVYGGEMSAHHYFRDFMFCDSGMIPWLVIADRMSQSGQPLSRLVGDMRRAFPSSGERNFPVADAAAAIDRVRDTLGAQALATDLFDGLSLTFADWRLNLRRSNTEPLLRLNVETRGDGALLARKVAEIEALVRSA